MSPLDERRREDLRKVRALCAASGGRVEVVTVSGDPPNSIVVRLNYPTAINTSYPNQKAESVDATIELAARYPFQEPAVSFSPTVYHPNVFVSGLVCLGSKWISTEGLDLLVKRLAQIVAFDPSIVGLTSPANRDALRWYEEKKRQVGLFPTATVNLTGTGSSKRLSWNDKSPPIQEKVISQCPTCSQKLSLPAGKKGAARCPKCNSKFSVGL
jgi:ubiquitin-protein ligase